MSYHCAVKNCSNGSYRLNKWKQQLCDVCGCQHGDQQCKCAGPFRLYPFPTTKKNPTERAKWKQLINRSSTSKKIWSPSKDSRVCSLHFKDDQPTVTNPRPTINLGYDGHESRVKRMLFFGSDKPTPKYTVKQEKRFTAYKVIEDPPIENLQNEPSSLPFSFILITVIMCLIQNIKLLSLQVQKLTTENNRLKAHISALTSKKYVEHVLDSASNVIFFTGLQSRKVFDKLHSLISPFVIRRWLGVNTSKHIRKFAGEPKRFGPDRKLSSKAEFLLTLMRLRLGLMGKDLAKRFDISESLCSRIFLAWLKACSKVLGALVFMPDEEEVIGSKPQTFRNIPDLHSIIDCTEIFIETPKDLQLQSATWSDYKHHNTLKVLVACLPNSSIIYTSPAYNGRISDKALTIDCGYLDSVPPYSNIMADKGFNLTNECAERNLSIYVPPGRRGTSQMTTAAVSKTKNIANKRIWIEQVIRRIKTFKIIQNELPISLVPHVDDILQTCSGICNLKKPIYK